MSTDLIKLLLSEDFWSGKITELSHLMPLEIFVVLGSLLEEVIAPIPSPIVMTLAGFSSLINNLNLLSIIIVILVASFAKTVGSLFIYWVADKFEDQVITKFGRFFGVNHSSIEKIGKKMSGGWFDDFFIFTLRAIPIVPSSLVSVALGVIKIPVKTFFIASFLGFIVRSTFYFLAGYLGISFTRYLENPIVILVIMAFLGLLSFLLFVNYFLKNKKLTKYQEEYLKQIGINTNEVGELLSFGFQHNVYKYKKSLVIKVPRLLFNLNLLKYDDVASDLEITKRYFKDFSIDTKIVTSEDKTKFVIIQKYIDNFSYLNWDNFDTVKSQFNDLGSCIEKVEKKTGKTIDLWGFTGIMSWLNIIQERNLPFFSNVVVAKIDNTEKLILLDTQLLGLLGYKFKSPVDLILNTISLLTSNTFKAIWFGVNRIINK